MRKALLALALMTSSIASAQITLERKYPILVEPFKLANGDLKYIGAVEATHQVNIYNANHSLLRQVAVPVAAGQRVSYVEYASDRLFNTNNTLEFIVYLNTTSVNTTRVMDETGAVLLSVDSCSYVSVHNTAVGTKMIAYPQLAQGDLYSKVYSLAGTYTPLRTANKADDLIAGPYPNPTTQSIRLPYTVKPGEVATLQVLDMSGRVVKSYQVDAAFDHLLLNAHELRGGAYVYRVTSAAGTGPGKKFIVRH
ncbi:Por secretion system C-terminal sorting domain-containing protein [Hymenobacter daecheongensis DSM 21074]|uniref:Por secretion system C-terminal sorting domain-containing protein n=1 Tax=Hymenobacter daecheongensis DSM 21074 TaxID=1121955 RepID=A0A1M6LZC0_9BACT|nr:T9SS type A sorting domain-containing protein [Hymenobacter daecheongensis]SHJ76440.1 Por secretion system C-terminal sorting domain-containing protein [Hymenobacter daecheongensis DSM 21074]